MLRALVLSFVREVVLLAAPFYMQMTVDDVIAPGGFGSADGSRSRLCAVGRRAPKNLARRGLPISKGCPRGLSFKLSVLAVAPGLLVASLSCSRP
jgi:hypothetical protein